VNRKRIGIVLLVGVVLVGVVVAFVMLAPERGKRGSEPTKLSSPEPETGVLIDEAHVKTARKLINGGAGFLLENRDSEGGWGKGQFRPATTALVVKALIQHPDFDAKHPVIADAIKVLMKYRHDDGGFYDMGLENYTTSIVLMTLVAVGDPQYKGAIGDAVKYLKGIQIRVGSKAPDGRTITEDDSMRGGIGYGEQGRPDLSNVGMTVEALHDAGLTGDDEAMREVVLFLEKTQNRKESNPLAWAQDGDSDGGFTYAPALKDNLKMGESKAGPAGPEGKGLRSYGSMGYVGFKSLIYAGLSKDDPRVKAAFDWIRTYWRLDSNPNMPQAQSLQGLYYYYLAFAKALRAWGEPVVTDMKGVEHNWRGELIDALAHRVQKDGSWVNAADRWEEGDPVLVTAYAVLALEETFRK